MMKIQEAALRTLAECLSNLYPALILKVKLPKAYAVRQTVQEGLDSFPNG
jgi:hypothetical protein